MNMQNVEIWDLSQFPHRRGIKSIADLKIRFGKGLKVTYTTKNHTLIHTTDSGLAKSIKQYFFAIAAEFQPFVVRMQIS
jgi:hypothetical protein